MSAPGDLSSILTSANWAMYRTGAEEPPPGQGVRAVLTDTHYSADPLGQLSWYHLAPQHWTTHHVLDWISCNAEESKLDARPLNFNGTEDASMTSDLLGDLWEDVPDFLKSSGCDDYSLLRTVIVQDDRQSNVDGYLDGFRSMGDMTPQSDNGYESGSASLDSSSAGTLRMPSSPESGGSDCELEFLNVQLPSPEDDIKAKREEEKPHKRGRGRPRKLSCGLGPFPETKNKHSPRGSHLWEFIRDILIHPEQNHGLMKWEDRKEGVFKFLKSEAVAQLWGQKKRNSSMTYEKLSRAMRYYYKREILERVDGRRLVYKFGKNSSGWKVEETGLAQ